MRTDSNYNNAIQDDDIYLGNRHCCLNEKGVNGVKLGDKKVDFLMILIALGWVIVIVLTLLKKGFLAMYVSTVIISAHMLVGLAHKGMINKRLFVYPFLCWLITFIIGIVGMQYFAFLYGDSVPDFLIFGMHPSFFFELGFYGIAGIVTLSLGIYK